MREYIAYVYILSNRKNGVLYIGVTSNLLSRIPQHKSKKIEGFTERYNVDKLVYYEIIHSMVVAISREKQMKAWKRDWKIKLIEKDNPEWRDLYNDVLNLSS